MISFWFEIKVYIYKNKICAHFLVRKSMIFIKVLSVPLGYKNSLSSVEKCLNVIFKQHFRSLSTMDLYIFFKEKQFLVISKYITFVCID